MTALWAAVAPMGARITTQAPVGPFRADILIEWRGARLVVEADGREFHTGPENEARDRARDAWMRRRGIGVMRCPGAVIHRDATGCADAVRRHLEGLPPRVTKGMRRKAASVARKRQRAIRDKVRAYAWNTTQSVRAPIMPSEARPTPPSVVERPGLPMHF